MGVFGRSKQELDDICSVSVLDDVPFVSSLAGSSYALAFLVEVGLHNILQARKNYTFLSHFPSKKIKVRGFSQADKDYYEAELRFYGYNYIERWKVFSLLDEKVQAQVSSGMVLSFTDAYVHDRLTSGSAPIDRYGNLEILAHHRRRRSF